MAEDDFVVAQVAQRLPAELLGELLAAGGNEFLHLLGAARDLHIGHPFQALAERWDAPIVGQITCRVSLAEAAAGHAGAVVLALAQLAERGAVPCVAAAEEAAGEAAVEHEARQLAVARIFERLHVDRLVHLRVRPADDRSRRDR